MLFFFALLLAADLLTALSFTGSGGFDFKCLIGSRLKSRFTIGATCSRSGESARESREQALHFSISKKETPVSQKCCKRLRKIRDVCPGLGGVPVRQLLEDLILILQFTAVIPVL